VKPVFLMRRVLILLAAGPLAGLAALSSSSSPIAAAAVTHGALHPGAGAFSALVQSTNWSGVAVTGGAYTRATGSWVVPTVKVTKGNRYAADWVGIGGYSSGDLIQAGTSEEIVSGHANYYAWTEILPAPESKISGFAVHPGDSMTVDVAEASVGSWTITVSDQTTAQVFTKNLSYASTNSSAEWVHEAPTVGGAQARLASTSKATFDHGTVNGSTVIGSAGTNHEIELVGSTRATPSGLDSDRDGFAVADGSRAPPPPSS
jgi:hypothetical protein